MIGASAAACRTYMAMTWPHALPGRRHPQETHRSYIRVDSQALGAPDIRFLLLLLEASHHNHWAVSELILQDRM